LSTDIILHIITSLVLQFDYAYCYFSALLYGFLSSLKPDMTRDTCCRDWRSV